MKAGRFVGDKCQKITESTNKMAKNGMDKLAEKTSESAKDISIPASILVGMMTLSVAFEAARGMIANVFEGILEAIMKISGALSDSLQENYRDKFSPKNDYQEIAIAIVFFIGLVFSSISSFFSTVLGTIKTGIVQIVLQLFGKDISNIVSHSLTIIGVWIQLHLLFSLLTPSIVFFGVLFMIILSFFLKMDDLPEDEKEKEEEKKKEEGEEKKEETEEKKDEGEEKKEEGEEKKDETSTTPDAPAEPAQTE